MAKHDNNKSFFSEWLEKLQQESWQLELLISGLALFGIYESQDLLIELKMYASNNSEGLARVTQRYFISILGVGWKIFFINLLIHVILRGLWIGAIGLRYVSQDIDYETLNYSEYFTKMLQKRVGGFDDFIERLEKICSVLFAYTFLLFLLFFSLGFFFFQLMLFGDLISEINSDVKLFFILLLFIYIIVGLVVFFDFITLGIFKKIEEKSVNKIYGYIFTFYGWTTLTFLYRPLLYNFLDNRYTKRLFFFSIPYILIILLSPKIFSNNNFTYYPEDSKSQKFGNTIKKINYEDLRKEYLSELEPRVSQRRQNLPNIILNKYMNDDDYLKMFLKMASSDYKVIQQNTDLSAYWKSGFNFSLFTSNRNEDIFYTKGEESLETEIDSINSSIKKLKRSRNALKDSTEIKKINLQIDSLSSSITDKRKVFEEKSDLFEEEKQTKIIKAFLDLVDLEINDTDIKNDLDCYFFQHSNNGEKGIMCMYPMDSLEMGKNVLKYFKEDQSGNENRKRDIQMKIPFYKVSSYN